MKCSSGKRVYHSEELALEALIEAHIRFEYRVGQGPVSVYRCDDCGQFHLTSKGELHSTLRKAYEDGIIKKHKQAHHWQSIFRRK